MKIFPSNGSLAHPIHAPALPRLADLIRSQADHQPDLAALAQAGRQFSYRQLLDAADAIAPQLQYHQIVAVTGPPCFGLVSALLATLQTGAVLVPIDPSLPRGRQQLLVREAGAELLLHAGPLPAGLAEPGPLRRVQVAPGTGRVIDTPPGPAARGSLPAGAAYIFFTSGTTGRPKAVLGSHQGLSQFLLWQRDRFGIGRADRVAQLTNLSFDVMLRAVFVVLVGGGTLCLPPATLTLDPASVLPWLQAERITRLHLVPSLAQAWLAAVPAGVDLSVLRTVFFAGEPLSEALVRRWRARFGTRELVNLYGPTETTMAKFYYILPDQPGPGIQPVGWPLPATEAYLADNDEILIRTPYRTLGYLNATADQQDRFMPNPERTDPADLLYRTGDRGRFRADGALEVLGRLDHQVKIQGVRIEPEEIGAVLAAMPGVAGAVVLARPQPGRDPVLVAYVVAPGLTEPAVRGALAEQLPAPMIPARIRFLSALPLTPNGKIDRAALPAEPEPVAGVLPRTELEQALAAIWEQVLGCDRVGLEDNFFELGGNSVRLAQVHHLLRARLQRELPITTLFQYPTIRALAGYLGESVPGTMAGSVAARARRIREAIT